MFVVMTSSPCDDRVPEGAALPCVLDARNGLEDCLRAHWKPDARLVVVSADPYNDSLNDEMLDTFARMFAYHGLTQSSSVLLDARTERDAARLITLSDVVLLGGGHVPTQNAFFGRIGLARLMRGYTGLVIGISAGSMNCARTVYAQPELPGESVDPGYRRYLPGLGLCRVQLLPHLQRVRDNWLDGRRLIDDITLEDSRGRAFIAIPDGSYVTQDGERCTLFGEGWLLRDGSMTLLCREGEQRVITQEDIAWN